MLTPAVTASRVITAGVSGQSFISTIFISSQQSRRMPLSSAAQTEGGGLSSFYPVANALGQHYDGRIGGDRGNIRKTGGIRDAQLCTRPW